MEEIQLVVARRLRDARIAAGLTQNELAAAAGDMSVSFLGAVERGERGAGLESLERLARALGIEPAALLSREGRARPSREERLARTIAALAKGADEGSIRKFERFARLWFER